ncbi:MAG: sugar transferase [Prevotellaceae bacterium]|nr:sugar transferase [Prevotella sp.]MDD7258187.1 sugar transferase [Prevotellaceae bacterium]MDY6130287.1 sugar transferase [Prevotella sp.]
MIRFFDILFSALGILILSPVFVLVYILVWGSSKGSGFFSQKRVGKDGVLFELYKFRTMKTDSEKGGLLTVGGRDSRITRIGYFLRKYKLDELPQLWNVLKGDMSLVGPRPEVERYTSLYTEEQREVLKVRPGITDYASIEYIDENEILDKADDPDRVYIEQIMPDKIRYNMKYIHNHSVREYFKIIFLTLWGIVR